MNTTAEPEAQEGTALVVFGLDGAGKARASAFNQADAERAERAAEIMGMHVVRPDSDEQHALARKLPRGRVFASGRAFVPYVKVGLYEALAAMAGASAAEPTPRAEPASAAPPSPPEGTSKANLAPDTWDDIGVGSIVLATEGHRKAGSSPSCFGRRTTCSCCGGATGRACRRSPAARGSSPCCRRDTGPDHQARAGQIRPERFPQLGLTTLINRTPGLAGSVETSRRSRIRELNDVLRTTGRGGRIVITTGIAALAPDAIPALLAAVAGFESFDPDNDPYGEQDCGVLTVGAERVIWKIDYYDRSLSGHSPDPADPAVTTRILTIMLAEEY